MSDNIILIGFMAVGKGRTARELATQSGNFAIDTDDLIESLAKRKIRKIFQEGGETSFRKLEAVAAKWLELNVNNTIVSTGGGFFMVDNLQNLGTVVYLHSSLEEIIATVRRHPNGLKKIKKRPLLQDFNKAKELFDKRLPQYRANADYEINVEGKEIAEVAREIRKLMTENSFLH